MQDAGVLLGEGGNDENTLGFGVGGFGIRGPEAGGRVRVHARKESRRGEGKWKREGGHDATTLARARAGAAAHIIGSNINACRVPQ